MSDFTFRISPNILLGPYTISRLGQQIKEWGTRFIIIMDPLLNEAKLSDKITQSLMDHKIDCFVFSELSDGAATKTIERALKLSQEGHIHGVIAVGGEKAINVGRAVAAYFNEAHNLYTFVDGSLPSTNPIPCICVPTTFRSAFVFTQEIPVTDSRNHQISILHVQNSICKLLLMDPNLMLTLTDNQKATLSIELIALATEEYLSQKANIFSDMFVEKGLEILSYALDGSPSLEITTPEEVLLVQAGCLISLAAASSSIGLPSLISLSIYSRYHKGRSLVSSILLPYVLEDAAKFKVAKLEILAHMLRAAPEDIKGEEAAKMLTEYVRQKIAKYSLPTRLKDLQLTVEQLSLAVEDISKINTINTLPRSMSTDDLFDFIKLAF